MAPSVGDRGEPHWSGPTPHRGRDQYPSSHWDGLDGPIAHQNLIYGTGRRQEAAEAAESAAEAAEAAGAARKALVGAPGTSPAQVMIPAGATRGGHHRAHKQTPQLDSPIAPYAPTKHGGAAGCTRPAKANNLSHKTNIPVPSLIKIEQNNIYTSPSPPTRPYA